MRHQALRALAGIMVGCWAGAIVAQTLQVQGTLLTSIGIDVYTVDVTSKAQKRLFGGDDLVGHYGPLRSPSFSPDGKKIAFTCENSSPDRNEIWIADNNGADPVKVCDYTNSSAVNSVNWCTDGYIYWCENTNAIYRVNVLTRQKETFWNAPNVAGYHEPDLYIEDMTVSNDGRIAVARGSGKVSAMDLFRKQIMSYGSGGCSGWISPGGTRIIHPYTCCVPFPAGATSYLHVAAVESVTVTNPPGGSLSPRPVIKFLWAPGQPNGAEQARVENFRFAKNSDDYVVGHGREVNASYGAIIYSVTSAAWKSVPLTGYGDLGLWIGALPVSSSSGPKIILSDTLIRLTSAVTKDTVVVTNGGTGTLGTLTITNPASWLTVTQSGTGNSRQVIISATAAGLTSGTHRANVALSGGGADNAPTIAVAYTIGTSLVSPSDLSAAKDASHRVALRWTDNSQGESGFSIERSSGGNYAEIGRTLANATVFTDSTARSVPGTYSYRVRAFDAATYSGYTETAQAVIAAVTSITLTSPKGGERFSAGSVVRITWTAQNVTAVIISLSTDDGMQWEPITTSAAIFATDSDWGSYPWEIPDGIDGAAKIQVADYNKGPKAISNEFTIGPDALRQIQSKPVRGRAIGVRSVAATKAHMQLLVDLPSQEAGAELGVWSPNGSLLGSARVASSGVVRIPIGNAPDICLVRMRSGGKTFTTVVAPRSVK